MESRGARQRFADLKLHLVRHMHAWRVVRKGLQMHLLSTIASLPELKHGEGCCVGLTCVSQLNACFHFSPDIAISEGNEGVSG